MPRRVHMASKRMSAPEKALGSIGGIPHSLKPKHFQRVAAGIVRQEILEGRPRERKKRKLRHLASISKTNNGIYSFQTHFKHSTSSNTQKQNIPLTQQNSRQHNKKQQKTKHFNHRLSFPNSQRVRCLIFRGQRL